MKQHIQPSTGRDTPKNPQDPWTSYRAAMNLPLRGHLSPSLLAAPTLPTTIIAGTPRQPLQGSAVRKEHGPWYDTKDGMFPPHDRLAAVDAGTFIVRCSTCSISFIVCRSVLCLRTYVFLYKPKPLTPKQGLEQTFSAGLNSSFSFKHPQASYMGCIAQGPQQHSRCTKYKSMNYSISANLANTPGRTAKTFAWMITAH